MNRTRYKCKIKMIVIKPSYIVNCITGCELQTDVFVNKKLIKQPTNCFVNVIEMSAEKYSFHVLCSFKFYQFFCFHIETDFYLFLCDI